MNNKITSHEEKNVLNKIKTKEVQDYSYAILFLLVSSFFAFFVIRPVLSIAVGLRREGQDLARINQAYEQNITKVLKIQGELDTLRSKKHLLTEALPDGPMIESIITDIRTTAERESISLTQVGIESIELKKAKNSDVIEQSGGTKNVTVGIDIQGNFDDGMRFMKALAQQRRIKNIEMIDISRAGEDKLASPSAQPSTIKLLISIQAYYL